MVIKLIIIIKTIGISDEINIGKNKPIIRIAKMINNIVIIFFMKLYPQSLQMELHLFLSFEVIVHSILESLDNAQTLV